MNKGSLSSPNLTRRKFYREKQGSTSANSKGNWFKIKEGRTGEENRLLGEEKTQNMRRGAKQA